MPIVLFKGNKNRSDSQLDAYVFEDSSFGGYSMAYDAIPPPLPPLTAQQHDAADYLQPLTSNTLRKSTRQSKTNLLPLPSNPRIASIRGSGSQSDHVDYVDGALYSDAKLEPFRVRQKSADIWTPRRSKQPPSRYRPASMQLLQPAGGGTFEYEADLQQYEEIPANFGTLPKSQPEKSMKWRPPAPPPVATPPLEPLRMTFPSHTLPSQADGTRRQCSSADGVLLSTVDKLSVDEWAQSTLHQDGGVRKNDCTVDQEVERAVSSMTRKGSYEEDSIILIDSDIYSGCKQTDNRTMT